MNEKEEKKEKIDISKLLSLRTIPYMKTYKSCRPRLSLNRSMTNPNLLMKQKPKIESVPPDPVPLFRVCSCKRTESTNLKGFRINFLFTCPDGSFYTAKIKPHSDSSFIGISEGKVSHVHSENFLGVILFGNEFCDASLREKTNMGKELLSIQIRLPLPDIPREVELHFFSQPYTIPDTLKSKPPVQEGGSWVVDLNCDNVVASIKNCCIEDSNNVPYFYVRKISEDVLEIEANQAISDTIVFALGIISFIGK